MSATVRSPAVTPVARRRALGGLTGRMLAASGLLVALVAGVFAVLILAINDLRESANVTRSTREALIAVDEVEKLVVDLETGLRGYVITGEDRFLAPWDDAQAALPQRTEALEQIVADHSEQSRRAQAISRGVRSYITDYGLPLVAATGRGDDSARSVEVTEDGKRRIDALRTEFATFRTMARDLLTERQDRADTAARRAVTAALLGLAGSIVLIALFAGYLTRAIVLPIRRAAQMAGRLAGGDLSTRMSATSVAEVGGLERAFNEMAGSLERGRDELAELASEQAALRRVATLVAERAAPEEVFSAVAEEVALRLGAQITKVLRYEADGTATILGGWSVPGMHVPLGTRLTVEDDGVAGTVFETGRPARTIAQEGPPGSVANCFRDVGVEHTIGSPIIVEGAMWGVAIAGAADPETFPTASEERIGQFTELVATAIANAESRAELAASRARIVAAADETRRRVERDLHDGAQQRLVTLALRLRGAAAGVPPRSEIREELERVGAEIDEVLEDLRELSRGIHPAILSEGGLGPALRTLVRRSTVPAELSINVEPHLPEPIEVAAYYVVSEALTNAAKHANASSASVDVAADTAVLRLAIRDDGVGGADPTRGSGLTGLKDRVEATGGTMTVESRLGEGTELLVELPIDGAGPADRR